MVTIKVKMDGTDLFKTLHQGERRLAYAAVNAVNETMLLAQKAAHQHVRDKFTERNEPFLFGSPTRPGGAAGRLLRATVKRQRAWAELFVGASTTQGNRRLLLSEYEAGGTKRSAISGAKNVAIPMTGTPVRPTTESSVAKPFYIANLKMRLWRAGKKVRKRKGVDATLFGEYGARTDLGESGPGQWKGSDRTFILRHSKAAPHGGIFQRTGPGRGDVRVLYKFEPTVKLARRMSWVTVVRRSINANFVQQFERQKFIAIGRSAGRPAS